MMTRSALLSGLLLAALPLHAAVDEADLLPVEKAFALSAQVEDNGQLALRFDVAEGYYLYRHRLGVAPLAGDGVTVGELSLPPGEQYTDEFFGEVETYRGELLAQAPLQWPTDVTQTRVEVRFQGCADVGVCYPPQKQALALALPARGVGAALETATNVAALPAAEDAAAGVLLPADAPRPGAAVGSDPTTGSQDTRGDSTGTGIAANASAGNPLAQLLGGGNTPAPMQDDVPAQREPPLPPEQAFVFEAIAFSPTQILARFTMPRGYYLYRDNAAFAVDPPSARIGAPQWPHAQPHVDDHFGEVFVFFGQVEVPIDIAPAQADAASTVTLTADFQGCQLDGICYPPMKRSIAIELPPASAEQLAQVSAAIDARPNVATSMQLREPQDATGTGTGANGLAANGTATAASDALPAGTSAPGTTDSETAPTSETDQLTGALAAGGWLTLGGFFVAGLLLAFTPCVLPMVPILSGLIAGAGTISTRRAFVLSLVYVLATAVVFTIAGVIAGLAGQNLQALFQKPWILISFAVLFVALAFSMFGFYELQLPARWQTRLVQVSNRQSGGSLGGVAVMGVLSALIVGPCVAPPLAAAVAYIGRTGDPVLGGSALFALALGMGVPLIAIGTGAGRWLPRAGAWMEAVKAVFGALFLFLAWWMLERILPPAWTLGILGALLIGCGVFMGAMSRLPDGVSGWRRLWQALGLVLIVLGAAQIVGALSGGNDYLRPLARLGGGTASAAPAHEFRRVTNAAELDAGLATAQAQGRTVLFDFYADWCVECKRMERHTFPEAPVQEALADVVMLKVDVTKQTPDDVALQQRFGIIGPPATLFFRDGAELRALRLVGYEGPEPFARRIVAAKATQP
jgi:thiol:disulfide interchange protein DsbD